VEFRWRPGLAAIVADGLCPAVPTEIAAQAQEQAAPAIGQFDDSGTRFIWTYRAAQVPRFAVVIAVDNVSRPFRWGARLICRWVGVGMVAGITSRPLCGRAGSGIPTPGPVAYQAQDGFLAEAVMSAGGDQVWPSSALFESQTVRPLRPG